MNKFFIYFLISPLTKQTWRQNYTQWIKNSTALSSADLQKDALTLTA